MLSRHWGALVGLISVGILATSFVACGNSDTTTDTTGAAGAGDAGAAGSAGAAGAAEVVKPEDKDNFKTDPKTAAVPPAPPTGATAPDGNENAVQAITKLFLGDTDRAGATSNDAWKDYGFDIDGLASTADNTYHCQAVEGGKKKDIRVDGTGGIDNSFGKNIVSIISGVAANPSATVSKAIADGSFSIVLQMDKLGTKADYSPVNTQLFAVKGTAGADGKIVGPTEDELSMGTYEWHAFPELLNADGTSKVAFPASYLTGNTFVSGATKSDITLSLSIQGQSLSLVIHEAQISTKLDTDHKTSANGNIGGVLNTDELVNSLKNIAGSLSTSLCTGSTFDSIATQIKQASDILVDGTQDPTKVCSGISIGIGFETTAAKLGAKADPSTGTPSPCP
jgi:hypothetical protein